MSKNLFVTGTGTDVGKTYVSALIVKKLREQGADPAYYKAAMSGNMRGTDGTLVPGDAFTVKTVSGIEQKLDSMCPFIYERAVSPHLASEIEGHPVQLNEVKRGFDALASRYSHITMEGSGGILCPLSVSGGSLMLEDVITALGLGCVIVARSGLGTINETVLTAFYMQKKGIPVKGVIYNLFHPADIMERDNIAMCERMTGLKTLALVKSGDTSLDISGQLLCSLYE